MLGLSYFYDWEFVMFLEGAGGSRSMVGYGIRSVCFSSRFGLSTFKGGYAEILVEFPLRWTPRGPLWSVGAHSGVGSVKGTS